MTRTFQQWLFFLAKLMPVDLASIGMLRRHIEWQQYVGFKCLNEWRRIHGVAAGQAQPQTHIKRPVVKRGHNGFSLENDGDVIIVFGGPFIHCNWTYRQTRYSCIRYSSFTPPVKRIKTPQILFCKQPKALATFTGYPGYPALGCLERIFASVARL